MSGDEISIASISNQKLENIAQKFEVAVFKKALDQQGVVTQQLIDSADSTPRQLPEGVGTKINVEA